MFALYLISSRWRNVSPLLGCAVCAYILVFSACASISGDITEMYYQSYVYDDDCDTQLDFWLIYNGLGVAGQNLPFFIGTIFGCLLGCLFFVDVASATEDDNDADSNSMEEQEDLIVDRANEAAEDDNGDNEQEDLIVDRANEAVEDDNWDNSV